MGLIVLLAATGAACTRNHPRVQSLVYHGKSRLFFALHCGLPEILLPLDRAQQPARQRRTAV